VLSDEIYTNSTPGDEKNRWLNKHIDYARRFVQLYPDDARSNDIALHAAELGYSNKNYQSAIQLASMVKDDSPVDQRYTANSLQARAYFALAEFADAEAIYLELLSQNQLSAKQKKELNEGLALSVY